jgi:hypothetical protein
MLVLNCQKSVNLGSGSSQGGVSLTHSAHRSLANATPGPWSWQLAWPSTSGPGGNRSAPRIRLVTYLKVAGALLFLRPWSAITIGFVMVIGLPLYWRYVVPGMARRAEDSMPGLRRAWALMLGIGFVAGLWLLGVGFIGLVSSSN